MKKTVAKNFLFLTFGEMLARILSLFLMFFIANTLGASGLGQFSLAMSVIAYFTFFTDFGLTMLGTREIAANKEQSSEIGTNVLFLQISLAALLIVVLYILVNFLPFDQTTKNLILILGIGLIPFAINVNYIFQAFQRMEFAAFVKILTQLVYVVLALIFLFYFRNIVFAAISMVIGNLVGAFASVFIALRFFNFKFQEFSLGFAKSLLLQALPMGVSAFLVQVFFNFDTTFLGLSKGVFAVGVYSAAYKLVVVINSFGYSYFGALFPIFSEKFKENDLAKIKDMGETSLRILFFTAAPIIAGIIVTAPAVINVFFQPEFVSSIVLFQILIFNVLLLWLNSLFGSMLIASRRQKSELLAVSSGTIVNVILNIALIPIFGAVGAAVISVFSQIVNFVLAYFLVRKQVKLNIFKTSYKSAINATVMFTLLYLMFSGFEQNFQTLVFEVFSGAFIYVALSLVTNNIPKQEVFFSFGKKVISERIKILE